MTSGCQLVSAALSEHEKIEVGQVKVWGQHRELDGMTAEAAVAVVDQRAGCRPVADELMRIVRRPENEMCSSEMPLGQDPEDRVS